MRKSIHQMLDKNIRTAAVLIIITVGCSDNKRSNPEPLPSQRSGQSVLAANSQYLDYQPTVNSDGTKVAFTSGRQGAIQRVYLSTFTSGTGFSTPERVTKDDALSFEMNPLFSPSSTHLLFEAAKSNSRHLILQKIGESSNTIVSSAFPSNGPFGFSDDSNLIVWGEVNESTSGYSIKIANINSISTAATLPTGTDRITAAFFLSVTSGYRVGVIIGSGASASAAYFDFTSTSAAASASKQSWISSLNYDGSNVSISGSSALVTGKVTPAGADNKKVKITGDGTSTSEYGKRLEAKLYATGNASGTEITNFSFVDMLSKQLAATGSLVLGVANTPIQCKEGAHTTATFATLIYLVNYPSGESKVVIPLTATSANSWEVSNNVCNKKRVDGTVGEIDTQILSAKINASATYSDSMIVYTSTRNNEYEVRAIQTANNVSKIFEVSNNKK